MKRSMLFKSLLVVTAGSLLAGGCVVRETRYRDRPVVVQQPPPAGSAIVEQPGEEVVVTEAAPAPLVDVQMGVAPGPDFVWVPGVWIWNGRWAWTAGHWGRPPRRGAVWVQPRYVYRGGVHVFVRGGWR